MRADIPKLKEALPLPALMRQLGLENHAKRSALCPLHEDASPSFSVYQTARGWRFKCHAGCGEGDEIDFLQMHRQVDEKAAIRLYVEFAGEYRSSPGPRQLYPAKSQERPVLPPDFRPGGVDELEAVARLRKVSVQALECMQHFGVLGFGRVCGFPCWILTDASGRTAEARRLDGSPFPAFGGGGERKAHTIRGSSKNWPVGLLLPNGHTEKFERILLLEGSGDLVAGYHFALKMSKGWLPVAMLGANSRIVLEALQILRERQIRIVPHLDKAGDKAASNWANQLREADCRVDRFDLSGIRKRNGFLVKDLGDCTDLHAEDQNELEELFK
jgi:hypothetical protein